MAEHGIAWILPRLIGMSRAMEWLMSARTLPASEAHAMGLVSEVFEPEELSAKAHARATEIAQTVSPRSIRVMKRQLWEGATLSLAQACRMAEKEVKSAVASQDFKEGVQHFMEKRPPRFTGQ
ncbi:enoyl-CoA hydratase-related protein [Hydrogenophaga intermedia]|uniref:enoyl-CoA hydratase-related protein n=1 Tax=Hydrogenophaga intermedia TaxID=65786 RepID=UPI0007738A5B|nr:enoyl-CoA hydratase-related protein [Hydrogenophaga intermedia]